MTQWQSISAIWAINSCIKHAHQEKVASYTYNYSHRESGLILDDLELRRRNSPVLMVFHHGITFRDLLAKNLLLGT